jgi:hypothetical protein
MSRLIFDLVIGEWIDADQRYLFLRLNNRKNHACCRMIAHHRYEDASVVESKFVRWFQTQHPTLEYDYPHPPGARRASRYI